MNVIENGNAFLKILIGNVVIGLAKHSVFSLLPFTLTGYPFPTAPPVDPFAKIKVDDCGKTKGCFRLVDVRVGRL